MMAIMVLGMPQVHGCHAGADPRMPWDRKMPEVEVCLPTMLEGRIGASAMGDQLDPRDWKRMPAVHCQATQSALTFTCGPDSRMGKVKFEKFQQPCGIQATACWETVESGKLRVGELEHPVSMNTTRSHMRGDEDCSRGCGSQTGLLNRKITQVLMEVLIEKEWIWWNEAEGKVATASGATALVLREGQVVMEDGLRVWAASSRVGSVDLPADGEAPQLSAKSRSTVGEMQVRFGYSCSAAGECAAEAALLATQQRIAIT
jgi:hypothetical protein